MSDSIITPTESPSRYPALIGWLLLCFGAATLGSFFSPGDWYTMMAVAIWLVWQQGGWGRQRKPMLIFLLQLALNALWSPLFFGLQRPGWAFAEILLLWLAIVATLIAFRSLNRWAMWLLVPYLAWVSFAAVLNFTLWQLNPAQP